MIRIVIFLVIVGLLALGFAWLAGRPGDVILTWQGRQFETSLMVVSVAILALFVSLILVLGMMAIVDARQRHPVTPLYLN